MCIPTNYFGISNTSSVFWINQRELKHFDIVLKIHIGANKEFSAIENAFKNIFDDLPNLLLAVV